MNTEIFGSELRKAVDDFRLRIYAEMLRTGKRSFSFPGGTSGEGENYELQTRHGLLSIIVVDDERHLNRYMHFINLDQSNDIVASDTEINIPKELDRRISTLLVKDQNHRYICNRGRLTVYRGSLRKAIVLDHFATTYNTVIQIRERDKMDSVIRIADLDSKDLFEQIALFTHQIKTFKNQFRNV